MIDKELTKNFILVLNNFISEKECNDIINKYSPQEIETPEGYKHTGYDSVTINKDSSFIKNIIIKIEEAISLYIEHYPVINWTPDKWRLNKLIFKHFKKNKSFNYFHSEHSRDYPHRILNIMIYLSTHKCGTEFHDGLLILSHIGRLIIFPSYFTHTHKGQVCPEKKDRYLLGGYYEIQ